MNKKVLVKEALTKTPAKVERFLILQESPEHWGKSHSRDLGVRKGISLIFRQFSNYLIGLKFEVGVRQG